MSSKSFAMLVERYRKVLKRNWSSEMLHEVLGFLKDQLSTRERESLARKEPPLSAIRGVSDFFFWEASRPEPHPDNVLPYGKEHDRESLVDQAQQASVYLLYRCSGHSGQKRALFMDTQSLLFLSVVHNLLPALESARLLKERNALVKVLFFHTLMWESDLPHMLYLRSVLFRYLKMRESEIESLVGAFRLTDPDDHDYLTKAQAAWMAMLEADERERAKAFMLDVYRRCPHDSLAEAREILDESYQLIGANND